MALTQRVPFDVLFLFCLRLDLCTLVASQTEDGGKTNPRRRSIESGRRSNFFQYLIDTTKKGVCVRTNNDSEKEQYVLSSSYYSSLALLLP